MDLFEKFGIGFIVLWVIGFLASIGLLIAAVIVAAHFIAKYW